MITTARVPEPTDPTADRPLTRAEALRRMRRAESRLARCEEQLAVARREVERLTRRDPLTGLDNRSSILELLERELAPERRCGRPLAVALLALEELDALNEAFGFAAGDRALVDTARLLGELRCDGATVGRHRGAEYMMVMPGVTLEDARRRIALLQRRRASRPFEPRPGLPATLRTSAALAAANPGESADELVPRLERALTATRRGRSESALAVAA